MPNFWLGLMLIVIFAAGLGWFPSSNFETWGALVLPAVTLSANSLAMITRMTRSSMLETIRQDYIRTARAKGLKESVITIRHALRNAMIPIVTTVGLQFGFSLGGAVLVETVFSWPGIGRLLVDCIGLKDTPVVVACVLVLATMFTIINLCIDILYAFLDPRTGPSTKRQRGDADDWESEKQEQEKVPGRRSMAPPEEKQDGRSGTHHSGRHHLLRRLCRCVF